MVLTYHHVIKNTERESIALPIGTYVTEDTFRMQMKFLANHFKVINLDDIIDSTLNLQKINKFCLITFDDGWRDNYFSAERILNQLSLPAAIFISTDLIEADQYYGIDWVTYWLMKFLTLKYSTKIFIQPQITQAVLQTGFPPKLSITNLKDSILFSLIEHLKKVDKATLVKLCQQLEGLIRPYLSNVDLSCLELMNWKELTELSHRKISFGSHTHQHVILIDKSDQAIETEILISKKILEDRLNKQITAFAYPDGQWNEGIVQLLEKAGYRMAFTNTYGFYDGKDRFIIPRINIHEDVTCSKPMFVCELSGIFRLFRSS